MESNTNQKRNNIIRYSTEEIEKALRDSDNDLNHAAKMLNVSPKSLSQTIYNTKRLRALFIKDPKGKGEVPDEIEQMVREVPHITTRDNSKEGQLVDAIKRENLSVMADGLTKAGIGKETINKLESLGQFERNAGAFLVGALDMMHRTVVYNSITLMEEAERIRDTYLKDPNLPPAQLLAWQRAYGQLLELQGKSYDRVLSGTQAMVKLSGGKKDPKKVAKAAFKPIT